MTTVVHLPITLESKLGKLKSPEGGILLTPNQIDRLVKLRYTKNGQPVLNITNRNLNYQVQNWVQTHGFEKVYGWLEYLAQNWNKFDPILDSPWLAEERDIIRQHDEIILIKPKQGNSVEPCPRCKSTNVTSREFRNRSADEPVSYRLQCVSCHKVWTI